MEVVNERILKAQASVDEARALIAPRKNAVDNLRIYEFTLLWADIHRALFPASAQPIEQTDFGPMFAPDQGYCVVEGAQRDFYQLKGLEVEGAKRLEEWAKHFGVAEMVV